MTMKCHKDDIKRQMIIHSQNIRCNYYPQKKIQITNNHLFFLIPSALYKK